MRTVRLAWLLPSREHIGSIWGREGTINSFDKDHPFILASIYGNDRLFVKQKEGVKTDLLPGDTQTFENPGAKDKAFEYENTIYLGADMFYAPGIGILKESDLVKKLKEGSYTRIVTPVLNYGKVKMPGK